MKFRYLSELGKDYEVEEGTRGHRESALDNKADQLQSAILALENLLKGKQPNAAGTPREVSRMKISERAKFFEAISQPEMEKKIAEARAKVERLREWLIRQGVVVKPDGSIDWGKDTARVVYDHEAAQGNLTKLRFGANGLAYTDDACRQKFDTTKMVTQFSGPGKAIYVMSFTGNIHVSSHSVGNRHHSSLLAGCAIAGAGEIEAKDGRIVWLSNKSGHYAPKLPHFLQVLHQLQKRNVPMTFKITWLKAARDSESFPSVMAFLSAIDALGEPDYELGKLMAYKNHLRPEVLAPNGWRYSFPAEKDGVYEIDSNVPVEHKTVRRWLKSQGLRANSVIQAADAVTR